MADEEMVVENLDPEVAVVIEDEDTGGAVIDFDGEQKPLTPDIPFDGDLSPLFTDAELDKLGSEIHQLTKDDDASRDEWKETYTKGLKLLGLHYEQRTEPWENACGAFHPMLLESVVRFNAEVMGDIFPGAGPVKTKVVGEVTPDKERQADRIKKDLNWQCTENIKGYRDETDMMLFNLPLAGTTFRKLYYGARTKKPVAEYVLPEHVVMPYTAASLASTPRFTVILPKTDNWIKAQQDAGFYRDIKISSAQKVRTDIKEEKDKIEGKTDTNNQEDTLQHIYECNIDYYFEEDVLNTETQPIPYIISVLKDSRKVLSIRRNWREGDPAMERQVSLIQHKYMPGFGPYGIGLVNILGGLTDAATSILRQLVDAGTLANLPAGYKTKGARVADDSTPIGPGEWRDVDVGMGTLKETFFPLPYNEPSTVLASLLSQMIDEGRRLGSVADMKIADMTGQNMPVGTTLAIIERSMKVMSGVQQRLYESFKNEFKVIAEITRDFMGDIPYEIELDPRDKDATRKQDYSDRVDVIPVADPNATTQAQRITILQSVIQLTQAAPSIYDLKAVHRDMIGVLGSEKAEIYIPPEAEVQPADPITENMALLTNKPVRAGIAQNHEAHIKVHMDAMEDPRIQQMLAENPSAGAIGAAAMAHLQEHMAFKYRKDIEEQLGAPLPPPGTPLPEEVEYELSRLAEKAADKLLEHSNALIQQEKIIEDLQDPVVQNEQRKLGIEQQKVDDAKAVEAAKLQFKDKDLRQEMFITLIKEMSETERTAIAVQVQKGAALTDAQMKKAEIAADLDKTAITEIGKLFAGRTNK